MIDAIAVGCIVIIILAIMITICACSDNDETSNKESMAGALTQLHARGAQDIDLMTGMGPYVWSDPAFTPIKPWLGWPNPIPWNNPTRLWRVPFYYTTFPYYV